MLWIEWYFIQSANTFYSQVRPCDMKVGESKHVAMLLIHEWVSLNRQMWVCLFLVCSSEQALKLPIRCWRRNYFKFSLRKSVLQIAMGWLKPLNFIFISILLMWQQDFASINSWNPGQNFVQNGGFWVSLFAYFSKGLQPDRWQQESRVGDRHRSPQRRETLLQARPSPKKCLQDHHAGFFRVQPAYSRYFTSRLNHSLQNLVSLGTFFFLLKRQLRTQKTPTAQLARPLPI